MCGYPTGKYDLPNDAYSAPESEWPTAKEQCLEWYGTESISITTKTSTTKSSTSQKRDAEFYWSRYGEALGIDREQFNEINAEMMSDWETDMYPDQMKEVEGMFAGMLMKTEQMFFDLVNADGDDKVTREEFDKFMNWVDMGDKPAKKEDGSIDWDKNFFMMDYNRDGKLSPPELFIGLMKWEYDIVTNLKSQNRMQQFVGEDGQMDFD